MPEMERRESPAAREAAVIEMVLKEVIVDRGVRRALCFGHGLTISALAASADELDLFQL